MKKIIPILCVLVLFCVPSGFSAEEVLPISAAPNLSVFPDSLDFGTIIEGEVASRVLLIKNTGNAELKIINVRSSCGCTAALLSTNAVAPGQATELKVSFNSTGYRSNFEKYVYLSSNDPDENNKTITIRGSVKTLPKINIVVEPPVWDFVPAAQGQTLPFQFLVQNRGLDKIKVSSIETSSDIHASVVAADVEPGKSTRIDVNMVQGARTEKREGYISVTIDIPIRYPNQ